MPLSSATFESQPYSRGFSPHNVLPNGRSITENTVGFWFCRACDSAWAACAKARESREREEGCRFECARRVVAGRALGSGEEFLRVLRGFDRGVYTPSSSGQQSRSTARKMQHMGDGPLFLASVGPRSPAHPRSAAGQPLARLDRQTGTGLVDEPPRVPLVSFCEGPRSTAP